MCDNWSDSLMEQGITHSPSESSAAAEEIDDPRGASWLWVTDWCPPQLGNVPGHTCIVEMLQVPRNLQAGNKAFSGSFDNPFDAWPINGTNELV
jgi:hypothetical protein